MRLTREERETHLWTSEAEDSWEIEASSPAMWGRLDKMFQAVEVKQDRGPTYSKVYRVPLSCVTIHKPRKVTEAVKEAMKRARANLPITQAANKDKAKSGDAS